MRERQRWGEKSKRRKRGLVGINTPQLPTSRYGIANTIMESLSMALEPLACHIVVAETELGGPGNGHQHSRRLSGVSQPNKRNKFI